MRPTRLYGASCIVYAERYMRPLDAAAWQRTPHILMRAAMGTGKTRCIADALRALRPASVLVVTPRMIFAQAMLGALRGMLPGTPALYTDGPAALQSDYLVCQLESLWKVSERQFDVVILDESERCAPIFFICPCCQPCLQLP